MLIKLESYTQLTDWPLH